MKQILIIDDDIYIGNMLEEVLTKEYYQVLRAYSGTEALLTLSSARPDLILLDLMLPGLSGEELLPKVKDIPVIVLSAKADLDSKVSLLLEGACDYVTKPFEIRELLARISVALRKNTVSTDTASPGDILTFDTLRLELTTHIVSAGRQEIRLTRTEFAICKLLMLHPSQILAKSQILERISEDTPDCTEYRISSDS